MGNTVSDVGAGNGQQDDFPELPNKSAKTKSPKAEAQQQQQQQRPDNYRKPAREGNPHASGLEQGFKLGDRIMPAAFIKVHRSWKGTIGKVFECQDGTPDGSYGIDWDNSKHSREQGKEIQFIPSSMDTRPRAMSSPVTAQATSSFVSSQSPAAAKGSPKAQRRDETPPVELLDEQEVEEEVDLTNRPTPERSDDPEEKEMMDQLADEGSIESTPVDILDPSGSLNVDNGIDSNSDDDANTVPLVPETVDVATPPLPEDLADDEQQFDSDLDVMDQSPDFSSGRAKSSWHHLGDNHNATQRGYKAFINHAVDDCRQPGMYRIIRGAILRATIDGTSQKVGGVKSGTVVTVDKVVDVDARLRGHVVADPNTGILADGWMSLATDDGSTFWVEPWGSKRAQLDSGVFKTRRDSRASDMSERSAYGEGEAIEIWSDRRARWEDGQVLERLPSGRYKVRASYETVKMYPTRIRGSRKGARPMPAAGAVQPTVG